jgi:hypothetical protein
MFGDLHKGPLLAALRTLRAVLVSNVLLCSVACLSVIGFLVVPNLEQLFGSIHFCVLGFAISTNALSQKLALRPLVTQLEDALKINNTDVMMKAKLESARDAFKATLSELSNPLPLHISVALLFGAVPVLTRKSCYWIPIAWMLASTVTLPIIKAWSQPKILEMLSTAARSADKTEPKQQGSTGHTRRTAQEVVAFSNAQSTSDNVA